MNEVFEKVAAEAGLSTAIWIAASNSSFSLRKVDELGDR